MEGWGGLTVGRFSKECGKAIGVAIHSPDGPHILPLWN